MSIAAYFIAILVIAIIFREDQREWPSFSLRLWVPLGWLIVTTTRIITILFPSGAGYYDSRDLLAQQAEGNPIIRNFLILFILLGIVALRGRKAQLIVALQNCKSLFLLHSYALISIAWSEYPDISIKRFIKLIGLLIIALIIACEEDYKKAFEHVFRRYITVCLIISIFLVKFGKGTGYVTGRLGYRFMAGIATHKNELAILCAFSLVFLVWRLFNSKIQKISIDALLILINIYLLVKARSATGYVAVIIGLLLLISSIIVKANLRKVFLAALIVFVPVILVLSIAVSSPFSALSDEFFSSVDREASLTGRIPLWEAVLNIGRSELLLGSGYESFWMENLPTIWDMFRSGPTNAHSGYVDLLVNLGAIGIFIFILFLINLGTQLFKEANQRNKYNSLFIIFFIIVLLGNITESSFMMLSLHWSLLVIIAISTFKISIRGSPLADEVQLSKGERLGV